MRCPFCNNEKNKVIDKRDSENELAIRRRRECLGCSKRFTTYERIESINIYIIKKNGNKEPFDKKKIEKGIEKSCDKRPVSSEMVINLADEIERELLRKDSTDISSKILGNLVMRKLKKLDKVAYIRFASVYREFEDLEEFQDELKKLVNRNKNRGDEKNAQ